LLAEKCSPHVFLIYQKFIARHECALPQVRIEPNLATIGVKITHFVVGKHGGAFGSARQRAT
jgi:hypothetical protein